MNHFYVTLPLDNSMNFYPNNTVTQFISKLPHRIRLDGDYEVGLAEFIYPYSWFNFNNDDGKMSTHFVKRGGDRSVECVFDSGQHPNEIALIKSVNDKINQVITEETNRKDLRAAFRFDETTRRIFLNVRCQSDESYFISDEFMNHFGFESNGPFIAGEHVAEKTFDVNDESHLIYVYCDIASFTAVGHAKAPLLRVCNISGKYGDTVRTIFTHPHYVPVARREIETIEININNELGKPMPFEFGKSVVTLHFRRRHSLLPSS
jgi:hypothetical protein